MSLVAQYIIPLAVMVSAAATTATAGIAWRLYSHVETHERALFGEQEVEGHDGIVTAVNENTQMTDTHRTVLRRHDLLDAEGRPLPAEQDERDDRTI